MRNQLYQFDCHFVSFTGILNFFTSVFRKVGLMNLSPDNYCSESYTQGYLNAIGLDQCLCVQYAGTFFLLKKCLFKLGSVKIEGGGGGGGAGGCWTSQILVALGK